MDDGVRASGEERATTEVRRLQDCINDLVSVVALPAIWSGRESSQIIGTLLDVLARVLRLEFLYARTGGWAGGSRVEMAWADRQRFAGVRAREIGAALDRSIPDARTAAPLSLAHPFGDGLLSATVLRFGAPGDLGLVVAGSRRSDFPTATERLILSVAANQAALGLQEARFENERRRAAAELERRVVEQTERLTKVNTELRTVKDQLAAELSAMRCLHEFSMRLLATTDVRLLLEEVLTATVAIQHADLGVAQLFDPETRALELVATLGFDQELNDRLPVVVGSDTACGQALHLRRRVVIEDVRIDPRLEMLRPAPASADFRAVQSTPLFGRAGQPLGVVSTYFRQPHSFTDHDLRFADLCARAGAEAIESKRAEENPASSETRIAQARSSPGSGHS